MTDSHVPAATTPVHLRPVDRYTLSDAILAAWHKHGNNSWCSIADEVNAALAAPQQGAPDFVLFPGNEEQAAGMALLGMEWLRQHAPYRLREVHQGKPQQGAPSDLVTEALRDQWFEQYQGQTRHPLGLLPVAAEHGYRLGYHAAQAVPVAVAERLPGEGDCAPWPDDPDATPWCWAAKEIDGGWEWVQLSMLGLGTDTLDRVIAGGGWTHWAPHWALPLPEAQP